MKKKKVGAFFDLDNTLLDGDAQELEFKANLIGLELSPGFCFRAVRGSFLYSRNAISSDAIVRIFISNYKGKPAYCLRAEADHFFHRHVRSRLHPPMLEKLDGHRKDGHLVFLLSASPCHLVEPVADFLNADGFRCTELEADSQGILTGSPKDGILLGKEKLVAAKQLAETHNIDLAQSYAYSDHHADIDLLEGVGHPVAVRPKKILAGIAKSKGWPIII